MQIKISDIVVGDRFRKTFEDIDELAKSIEKHGQIEPIVIDEHNNLIAGERRLKACILLKKEDIEAKVITELTELEKKELELEENIQRKAFTWQEEVDAKDQLHALKQKMYGAAVKHKHVDGSWKLKDTAATLGESVGTVSMDIQLSKGMRAFPELMKEKSKVAAFKKLKVLQERILQEELAKRIKGTKEIQHPSVIYGDCLSVLQKMESDSVDLVLTDPPYGIDIGESHIYGRMSQANTYADQEFETYDLLDKVVKELYRILRNNRHMYMFFAIDKYDQLTKLLVKHGFEVHPMPLIWDKGSGSYPSQGVTYTHSYEPFLHIFKGDRKLNGTPRDVFPIKRVPGQSKIHPSQKPTELLRDLISLSTLPGDLVLDPFAGSGSTLVAAKETGRRALGIELNAAYYENICKVLEESHPNEEDENILSGHGDNRS